VRGEKRRSPLGGAGSAGEISIGPTIGVPSPARGGGSGWGPAGRRRGGCFGKSSAMSSKGGEITDRPFPLPGPPPQAGEGVAPLGMGARTPPGVRPFITNVIPRLVRGDPPLHRPWRRKSRPHTAPRVDAPDKPGHDAVRGWLAWARDVGPPVGAPSPACGGGPG
jgi:hypothetical protein